MLATLQQTLARWNEERPYRKVLLAVSGGADSMALLQALHRLWTPEGVELVVAHVHHGLRGGAAEADVAFVRAAAARLGLPCHVARVNVPAALRQTSDSVEMAARELRWKALRRMARRVGADAICTGHTADDQIETLFLRLGRGTGPRGLCGMARCASRPGQPPVLRPLLGCRRVELRAWLQAEGVVWREDASNAEEAMVRNRVRRWLVPAFERALGSAAVANALRSLGLLRDEQEHWLAPLVEAALEDVLPVSDDPEAMDLRALRALPRPLVRRVLLAWLQRQNLPPALQTLALLDGLAEFSLVSGRGSRRMPLGQGSAALRTYDRLRLVPDPAPCTAARPDVALKLPGRVASAAWGLEAVVSRTRGFRSVSPAVPLTLPQVATLSAAAVADRGLTLRTIRPGDRLSPLGLGGRRKVSDLLIDRKIPREDRARMPVLACGDEVAWLPGIAVSAPFAVPDAQAPAFRILLRRTRNRSGFSLVEALVALALLGLVLVPGLVAMQRLLRAEARLESRLSVELLARESFEEAAWDAAHHPERMPETRVVRDAARRMRLVLRFRPAAPQAPARLALDAVPEGLDAGPAQNVARLLFPQLPAGDETPSPSGGPP